jgi:hypothetical protein
MYPIDNILISALNGQPQRIGVDNALAIGAAVRAMATIIENDAAVRAEFAKSYGTISVEALAKLTTTKP